MDQKNWVSFLSTKQILFLAVGAMFFDRLHVRYYFQLANVKQGHHQGYHHDEENVDCDDIPLTLLKKRGSNSEFGLALISIMVTPEEQMMMIFKIILL